MAEVDDLLQRSETALANAKAPKVPWGSEQEQYVFICMKLLLARYYYYVLAKPMMSDAEYDHIEDGLKAFEAAAPHLAHPQSPTKTVGSDNPDTYPRSIRRFAGLPSTQGDQAEDEDGTSLDLS